MSEFSLPLSTPSVSFEKIISSLDKYFNHILRNYLRYPETYHISFSPSSDRITLSSEGSETRNSKLSEILKENPKRRSEIEQTLLSAFRSINDQILNFNIYTFNPNEIIITYTLQSIRHVKMIFFGGE